MWLVAAVLLLLALLWLRRRRRRRTAVAVPPPANLPPPPAPAGGLAGAVRRLRQRYRSGADLRRGLQELSALLRGHFAAALPAAERHRGLTAVDLARRLGEVPAARLLRLLASHQFGRREPTADDFDAVCDLAEATVEGRAVPAGGARRPGRR